MAATEAFAAAARAHALSFSERSMCTAELFLLLLALSLALLATKLAAPLALLPPHRHECKLCVHGGALARHVEREAQSK